MKTLLFTLLLPWLSLNLSPAANAQGTVVILDTFNDDTRVGDSVQRGYL